MLKHNSKHRTWNSADLASQQLALVCPDSHNNHRGLPGNVLSFHVYLCLPLLRENNYSYGFVCVVNSPPPQPLTTTVWRMSSFFSSSFSYLRKMLPLDLRELNASKVPQPLTSDFRSDKDSTEISELFIPRISPLIKVRSKILCRDSERIAGRIISE